MKTKIAATLALGISIIFSASAHAAFDLKPGCRTQLEKRIGNLKFANGESIDNDGFITLCRDGNAAAAESCVKLVRTTFKNQMFPYGVAQVCGASVTGEEAVACIKAAQAKDDGQENYLYYSDACVGSTRRFLDCSVPGQRVNPPPGGGGSD